MAAIAWRLPPDTMVAARMSRDRADRPGPRRVARGGGDDRALPLLVRLRRASRASWRCARDELGIAPRSIFFTAFALTVLVTRVFSGRLADRVGHRRFLLPCLALVTVGPGADGRSPARALQLVVAAAVFGLGFGNQYPAFVGHVMKFVDPARRGAAFGGILAAFDTGVGTGSIGVGAHGGAHRLRPGLRRGGGALRLLDPVLPVGREALPACPGSGGAGRGRGAAAGGGAELAPAAGGSPRGGSAGGMA